MSPIPIFDHNNVLPPHLGNPTIKADLSPYQCTTLELCHTFASSLQRVKILKGLIEFRSKLNQYGIVEGFQWLDGSFTENIEVSENRPPNDLDIITLFNGQNSNLEYIKDNFPEFIYPHLAKARYYLDHYPVDFCYTPEVTVELTRYWIQLFTHNRKRIWKGILRLPLNSPQEDAASFNYLDSLTL
jgi:hypothetical protein